MGPEIIDENKGQAFSLDAMLALVIIVVIMGITADAMDLVSYRMQDYSSRFSLERTATDAADSLVKTPGSPENWETSPYTSDMVPGLAKMDPKTRRPIPNTLTFEKISKLTAKYTDLMNGKIIPDGASSSMVVYPLNPSLRPIAVQNNTPPSQAAEIAVANRTVSCDYMYSKVLVGINTHRNPAWSSETGGEWEICTHVNLTGNLKHEQPDIGGKPGWTCRHFNVTQDELNSTDFYVITDPMPLSDNSARWSIDRPENMSEDDMEFGSAPVPVNFEITQVLGADEKAALWFHVKTAGETGRPFDAYIVGVPRDTPLDEVKLEYLSPQPCFFVLWIWL